MWFVLLSYITPGVSWGDGYCDVTANPFDRYNGFIKQDWINIFVFIVLYFNFALNHNKYLYYRQKNLNLRALSWIAVLAIKYNQSWLLWCMCMRIKHNRFTNFHKYHNSNSLNKMKHSNGSRISIIAETLHFSILREHKKILVYSIFHNTNKDLITKQINRIYKRHLVILCLNSWNQSCWFKWLWDKHKTFYNETEMLKKEIEHWNCMTTLNIVQ